MSPLPPGEGGAKRRVREGRGEGGLPLVFLSLAFAALALFRAGPALAQEAPAALAQEAPLPERGGIGEIRVEGNQRTEAEQIYLIVRTRVGEPVSRETLAQDVRDLYGLGLYSDIAVDVTESAGGYVVTFQVTERPSVAEVKIEGTDEIKEIDIEETIGISANTVFTDAKIEAAKKRILAKYAEKGYYLAQVDVRTERDEERNQVHITFHIEEGEPVHVRWIEFKGNKAFGSAKLKTLDGLLTTEEGLFSWATDSGKYQAEALDEDVQRLTLFYMDEGYLEVRIGRPSTQLTRDRKSIYITIPIEEGPRFKIGKLAVAGDLLWPAPELLEGLATREGDFFSRRKVVDDSQKLSNRYGDESYAFANVVPDSRVWEEGGRHYVDITFTIEKGEPVSVNRILIAGNVKTRDKVIRREMRIVEGAKFNRTLFDRSKQRIQRLGFFEEVTYALERVPGARDRVNVKFEVKERPTGSVQVGAGFSSLDKFFAQAQISQANLFGRGQRLEFQGQVGGRLQSLSVTFEDPRVFDTYWSGSVSGFTLRRTDVGFETATDGGQLRVGYELTELSPLLEDVSASVGISFRHIKLTDSSSILSQLNLDNPLYINLDSITSSLSLYVGRVTFDDRLDPTKGTRHSVSVEYADNIFRLGLDTNRFVRYQFEGAYYHPLPAKFVGSLRWSVGLLQRGEELDSLFQERFRGGGITDLRGYSTRSVGPYQRTKSGQLYLLGGDKEFYSSAELLIPTPLSEEFRLRPVVFFDMGNVYNDSEALFSSVLMDAGFGIRWFSPLGPIRFEFGWPINNEPAHTGRNRVSGPVFNFTIGQLL